MTIIGMIFLIFFALIGAAAFISALFFDSTADKETAVVLENLIADNAEIRVRRTARLCDRIRCERLICRCADEESEQICARLNKEFRIIEIE